MKAIMLSTTNPAFKYFENVTADLTIKRQAFFGNLYTSRIRKVIYNHKKDTSIITIETLNSTYVFETIKPLKEKNNE